MMNIILLITILVGTALTTATQAQTFESKTQADSPELSGFYSGLEYANLTDVRMESNYEYFNGQQKVSEKDTSTGGTHLGLMGLSLGYQFRNLNASAISISTGLRVMQSFNKSEYGDDKITFYIPEVNFGYLVSEKFETYGGVSVPVIRGNKEVNRYEPRGGINLGIAAHATKQFTIKAAYNAYAFHYKFDDPNFNGKLDMAISGLALTTQLNF